MSGVITTSHFGKALWPGINAWYGKAYEDYPVEYTDLFDTFKSSKAFEEDVMVSSFGLAPVKEEGAPIQYDSEQQGFISRYSHVTYALGFVITREMFDDDQYDIVGQRRAQALARSMRQTKETVAANVYNRAFNSSYTGGDGKELCATDHPNVAGGTWSNELTTAADLSEAALEQAVIDMMAWTDDRGLLIAAMPEKLILPPELIFEAERILETPLRVGTADNDVNALKNLGKFRGGVTVNHYLTDADAWFIRTNVANGMKHFERKADSFAEDNDFDTDNAKFKASARYSFGWSDPRGIFGSPGA
jgi:phage major head subunit gpT-like protein